MAGARSLTRTRRSADRQRTTTMSRPRATRRALRIIIVDDDEDARGMTAEVLESEGAAVTAFSDGMSALAHLARGGDGDLICLDLAMPEMSGEEFLRAYRDGGGRLPVILVSGEAAIVKIAERYGLRWVAKPVAVTALLSAIRLLAA
jgi:CheY-like chemotaxis protein